MQNHITQNTFVNRNSRRINLKEAYLFPRPKMVVVCQSLFGAGIDECVFDGTGFVMVKMEVRAVGSTLI